VRTVVWLIAALVWAIARPAAADDRYGVVTLDLRPTSGEMPTHLCVVSETKSARARDRLWDLVVDDPEKVGAAGGTATTLWRVQPKAWSGEADSAEQQKCADGPIGDCRPRVELPPGLTKANDFYAACTYDTLADGGATADPRPLFVLLEHLEGSPPRIESVRLTGGVATIGVDADLDRVVVTARSLGGGYLPHRRSERGVREQPNEGQTSKSRDVVVVLQLVPRCQSIELTLQRTPLQPEDRERLSVRAHGVLLDVDKCVGPLVGTEVLQVRLPQAPLGVGTIDVELAPRPGRAAARFGGRYDGAWPKAPFELKFKQVSFTWKRPACIYSNEKCPSATLENGTACQATVTKTGCNYVCPGVVEDGGVDIVLPIDLTFEREAPVQRWDDTLARSGQTLSSYVKADEIHLDANVNAWETDKADNQISHVEIFGEDGSAKRYGVTHVPNLQLAVPGASCEPVRFRPIGDRHYDEGIANVANGKIEFGAPERRARRVAFTFMLAAGGGPAWSGGTERTTDPPLYFSGLGMFGVEIRPRNPKWSRLALEMRVGGTLGRYGVTTEETIEEEEEDDTQGAERTPDGDADAEDTTDIATDTARRDTGWARLLLEPVLVISAHQRIAIGTGLGLGVSLPFRSREDVVGNRVRFIASPSVDFRFRVRRWIKLVVQFRGVLNEQPFAQGGNKIDPNAKAASFMTLLGVQATF
jgi:hypothetical protein